MKSIASTDEAAPSSSEARAPVNLPIPAPSSTTREPAMGPRRDRTWKGGDKERRERRRRGEEGKREGKELFGVRERDEKGKRKKKRSRQPPPPCRSTAAAAAAEQKKERQ